MNAIEPSVRMPAMTVAGVRHGLGDGSVVALSVLPWGLAYGLLAQQSLSLAQTLAMSGYVFSGTAQFVALDMWRHPLAIGALLFAVAAINARYLLQGVTLAPWLSGLRPVPRLATLFFLSDASWAMSLKRFEQGGTDAGYLLGTSLAMYAMWLVSSVAGYMVPLSSAGTASWGLDFAVSAALIGLAGGRWSGRADIAPWLVAAIAAYACHALLDGYWYMLAGGFAGAAAAAWREQ